MKRQHRIWIERSRLLTLGVSAAALLASSLPASAQDLERPNLKVLVYNIWNQSQNSLFWQRLPDSSGNLVIGNDPEFTAQMSGLLELTNPDIIIFPELSKNEAQLKPGVRYADQFARRTIEAMNEHRGAGASFIKNDNDGQNGSNTNFIPSYGRIFSAYTPINLPDDVIRMTPTNGFPTTAIYGIHLDAGDLPTTRRTESRTVNLFSAASVVPVIAGGDFNAADIAERGLLSGAQQLKSWARHVANANGATATVLPQYARNPAHLALLNSEQRHWRENVISNGRSVPRYEAVLTNWSTASWDARLAELTAQMLTRNSEIAFNDELYPIPANAPITLNILKKQHQLLQLDRNREIFAHSVKGDGRSTWTSDGREDENVWHWWDRSVIDHIISSRPFAKWTVVDVNDPNTGILNGRTTNAAGVDPSDHEPVAQNILWYGPRLTPSADGTTTDLSFSKEDLSYDARGEFVLSRNNQRTDVRFDNISDQNGLPIYRDDVNAVGKLGRALLNTQVSDLIARGLLKPQAGLDYANDPNAALKMQIPCGNKDVLQTIAGAAALCVDNHSKFNSLTIKDGVVAFDEAEALGNASAAITLKNGGLRTAGPSDRWAQWTANPFITIEKPIVLEEGTGSFDVADPNRFVALKGVVSGAGSFEKRGEGVLQLIADNSYSGTTVVAGGTLRAGSAKAFGTSTVFDVRTGRLELGVAPVVIKRLIGDTGEIEVGTGGLSLDLDGDKSFRGTFDGSGTIVKADAGRLTLNGTNTHSGAFIVGNGALVVGDAAHPTAVTLSSVVVHKGASLGGVGMIGGLSAQSGSRILPGNSIGTLRINGDARFQSGSVLDVEIAGDGRSDRLLINGRAVIEGGGVEVTAVDPQTSYLSGQSYRLLDASGGVSGRFDRVSTGSAFLDLGLSYSPQAVDLLVNVKARFTDTAQSPNEQNTAASLQQLNQFGSDLSLFNSVLPLSDVQSRAAFNALSGEIHASVKGALVDDSRFARQAANKRLLTARESEAVSFWSNGYGAWGKTKSDGNAATLDRKTGGLFMGGDAALGDNWQLGLFGGYGRSSFDAAQRGSKANVDSYTLGAYAGTWFDPVGVRFGLANSWHSIDVNRFASYAGFDEMLKSSYDARSLQVFGEVSSKVALGGFDVEPFLGLAYVDFQSDSYRENGIAALNGSIRDGSTSYSTLGLRFGQAVDLGGTKGALTGSLAWQHAFGSTSVFADQSFSSGGGFTVAGVPMAKNTALLEVGYDWALSDTANLGLFYQGQLGSGQQQHGVNAKLQVKF